MLKPSLNSALHQPSLTALLPLYLWLQGTGASLCALAEVSGLPKSRVSFHRLGWVWLKRTTTEIWVGQSLLIRQRVGRGAVSSEFPPGRGRDGFARSAAHPQGRTCCISLPKNMMPRREGTTLIRLLNWCELVPGRNSLNQFLGVS